MKILHCCLAAFYIDGYGYQENILPKMHHLQGHSVNIVASTETYLSNRSIGYLEPSRYKNNDGIFVERLPYTKWLPHKLSRKIRIYSGLKNKLEELQPDIIFLHDCQFLSIVEITNYVKKHSGVKIFVDGHTDHINSAKTFFSKHILHRLVYKWCAQNIEPYVTKFYGTTPLRVEFFSNIYKIPMEKIELLNFGVDDSEIDFSKREDIRINIRKTLNIAAEDLVLITGGKLDKRKNIHLLMSAMENFNKCNLKLLVFGEANAEIEAVIDKFWENKNIIKLGWLTPDTLTNYFFASDLAIFPGTHSVVWEQAAGLGVPCVLKRWQGIEHLDLGGNCMFLNNGDEKEIRDLISKVFANRSIIEEMTNVAIRKGITHFAYSTIAQKALSC